MIEVSGKTLQDKEAFPGSSVGNDLSHPKQMAVLASKILLFDFSACGAAGKSAECHP